ncbi:MAG TPA: PEP-CTERM sorting domain-containing protein [Tepidisphaeraceae bacterium]|nr:PEP-CTERM sorting domain-containing protein [Tepidisphaeraceae bacterium]
MTIARCWGRASAAAVCLAALPSLASAQLAPLSTFGGGDGYLVTGDRTYLTADHSQRGLEYNPLTNNLYVVDRDGNNTRGGLAVHMLDGTTGAHVRSLNVSGVTGGHAGTFAGNQIQVADDGAIYLANMVVNGGTDNFRIWRWANEAATISAPTLVYEGNPAAGGSSTNIRVGDSFDIRGGGASTQMIFGVRHTPNPADIRAVIFNTTDGTTYSPKLVTNTVAGPGSFYIGTAWGNGNQFYGNTAGASNPVFHMGVDPSSGAATVLATNAKDGSGSFTDAGMTAIEYHPALNAMVGVVTGNRTDHHVQLYDLNDFSDAVLLDSDQLPNAGDAGIAGMEAGFTNGNGTGAIAFGPDGRVYALITNVGLAAYTVPEPGSVMLLAVGGLAMLRRRRGSR